MERDYHDAEWGVPVRDDRALFEMLCLEGAQAGLSWRTVLAKRERYREAFHGFEIARVAAMPDAEIERLLTDPGVIRHRQKLFSVRANARAALLIEKGLGALLWGHVSGATFANAWPDRAAVPVSTPQSDAMSRDLKRRGFGFVGSTICYAFMQATGMVNDHVTGCFRHAILDPTRKGGA
jgi:DNA-3-methyladenine glycosylase I